MNKKLKKIVSLAFAGMLAVGVLAGCGSAKTTGSGNTSNSTQEKSNKKVNIGYVNWAEGIAMTNLAKVVLEEKMGYEVDMKQGEAGMVFTSLAGGDMDVFMDGWLPVTHKDYMEKYKEDLEDLGYNYENARIGLVVPAYMNIKSIEELNGIKDDLEGKIIGIDPGAGIMKSTKSVIEEYGLDLELLEGSEATMLAMLKKAIDDKKPIVITGWSPHWKFSRWDLKFLDDPKGTYGKAENLHTIARKGFSQDMPEVAEFLKNFKMNDDQLGSLMADIQDSDKDPSEVAKEWMHKNEELVNSWIPKKN
ncbi:MULTISPECIES: glycine betaine ABC transporter substrate-binding protein [Clostridium]|jgi:glycine betaine/proline transport system substrate-binding protein|uniref:Glycine betaine-binding protein OpuAC n=2 Tax=Clostridium TaxID=1485 RepID=A0A151API4_9CLOT|nr:MULTISPECIES: glycine betaine ABC transporter substrate-binding protein [Clostridium]KYH29546.1 glycine betaine-binding protein OpuAC precursor [Clostridium colicanis DSM 13634]MBE6043866.1 glycine betaine ABC transporter substrate-binding protein [Clostridium thermopalmarium]PRR72870.1 Glycine betaine-binding protein OpuAC precursor [Clostridium thermopalmarium DSM 5974]PVZ21115.1 glycine betaine/proline transport system substrate-binding protein [Clostridium thermopalmarium DSM 5974]